MKRLLICLALTCSAFARARVVPPIPTNLTPVTLYLGNLIGCATGARAAAVQRTGQSIRVQLGFYEDCVLTVVDDWHIAVPLGALEPGHYEVIAENAPLQVKETVQFEVLDATTFPITPPGIHVNRCSEEDNGLYAPYVFDEASLRIGNGTAVVNQFTVDELDCPEPGLKDVEVTSAEGETVIARNAFTVYEGPGSTHPYVYEDVLVPIYFNGLGGGGDWRSKLSFRASDSGNREVPLVTPWGALIAGQTRSVIAPEDIGNRANGFFLRVARNGVERFRPELHVWNAAVIGVVPTLLPVVRERDWLAGASVIESLPVEAGTRVTVRVYAPDDDLQALVVEDLVRGKHRIHPAPGSADSPRFAAYEFIVSGALGLPKLTFSPEEFGSRYWVMVTLSNDDGRVVFLTPQPEETRR